MKRAEEKQNKKERETQKDKKDSTSKQCHRANKPYFRPGGVRAARSNPPPPFRGSGVLNTTSIPAISSFSTPRTLRRASAYFAPKSHNLNFSFFSTVFCPFKNFSNFDLFPKPPKITKTGARAQN